MKLCVCVYLATNRVLNLIFTLINFSLANPPRLLIMPFDIQLLQKYFKQWQIYNCIFTLVHTFLANMYVYGSIHIIYIHHIKYTLTHLLNRKETETAFKSAVRTEQLCDAAEKNCLLKVLIKLKIQMLDLWHKIYLSHFIEIRKEYECCEWLFSIPKIKYGFTNRNYLEQFSLLEKFLIFVPKSTWHGCLRNG